MTQLIGFTPNDLMSEVHQSQTKGRILFQCRQTETEDITRDICQLYYLAHTIFLRRQVTE